jgi:hypothetical protein
MRARCVGGPYAGQTFEFPMPKILWYGGFGRTHVGPLIWIINGPDRHCYSLVQTMTAQRNVSYTTGWYLVYRDTF